MNNKVRNNETVGAVGEREFIRRIQPYLSSAGPTIHVPAGDDAAVVSVDSEKLVLTADMLVEGTHFLRNRDTNWNNLGRKALTSNISDIGAMGARPMHALISIGVPQEMVVSELLELYRGIHEEAVSWKIALAGGDTTGSPVLTISIALTGSIPSGRHVPLRSGCKPGQDVYVTGKLGGSRAGLECLCGSRDLQGLSKAEREAVIVAHQAPSARADIGVALAAAFDDLAMIDISDSLYNELGLLAEASAVGLQIDLTRVPIHPALRSLDTDMALGFALFSGEEYQLLFTTSAKPEEITEMLRTGGLADDVSRIGTVTADCRIVFLDSLGKQRQFVDATFSHFRKNQ